MKGFTLIEVIIALALIVVTVTLLGVALSSLPLTKRARNQNLAYHIAAKKIEELRNTAFTSLPSPGPFSDPGLSDLASSTASFTITDYAGSAQIKKISISVNWYEQNQTRNVLLETLISNSGLNQ